MLKRLFPWRRNEAIMRKNVVRIVAGLAVCMLAGVCVFYARGQQGIVDETAVVRKQGEGAGKIFIDDQSLALAGAAESSTDITNAANSALAMVNVQRAAAGLADLSWSQGLADAASVRAKEIVSTFSHTRPDGSDWWTVNSSLQYGENLAKLYESPDSVVNAWMASPTHKANIMDAGFKTCGISIYPADNSQWYWAQEFGY